jgi:acyl-CoA synthetase (NDP forming)
MFFAKKLAMADNSSVCDVQNRFRPLFEPRSIAIVGASNSNPTRANDVLAFTRAMGFAGPIYPIHPTAESVDGLRVYQSFSECPTDIDYAFVAIGAGKVPDLLATAKGRVRFAQIMASGFDETAKGETLTQRLLSVARENSIRLIGPNCLGTYSPKGRLTYIQGCPKEAGTVGLVSQSGGISTDMLRRGVQRGLRYSAVVSVGNCVDLGPVDFLEYFLADNSTKVIGFYLESLPNGRRFYEALRDTSAIKPVVILKGGRTGQGQRVALSHTGALAGDDRLWTALSRQTGATLVNSIDELIDTLLAFQCLRPRIHQPGNGAFLIGNGGGASVLATDFMTRIGVPIREAKEETKQALTALALPVGTTVDNPLDAPSGALRLDEGRIAHSLLATTAKVEQPDAILFHVNMPQFLTNPSIPDVVFDNLVDGAVHAAQEDDHSTPIFLALRSDGSAAVDERKRPARDRALAAGVPVYDEISHAIIALSHFQRFERFYYRKTRTQHDAAAND